MKRVLSLLLVLALCPLLSCPALGEDRPVLTIGDLETRTSNNIDKENPLGMWQYLADLLGVTLRYVYLTPEAYVTALDNATGYREKEPGFKDVGDLTCSGFLDGADEGQTECYTLLNSGETKACQIIFPTKIGKTWSFNASVIRFSTGAEVGGAVTFEMTLAVTGQPTLAATTKP